MLVGAAIAFYVASRAAADAVSEHAVAAPSPTRHALAQWIAIACVCAVAVWLEHAEIAVGVIFSTAVAALSLHLGVTIASAPETRARRSGHGFEVVVAQREGELAAVAPAAIVMAQPVRGSRAWAMVLPVGVLALIAGFSGKLTLVHALLFAVQGLLIMMVWDGSRQDASSPKARKRFSTGRWAQLVLATALALVGAVLAVYGAVRMSDETRIMSTGLIASAALGPLLVLPMIGSASLLASQGQAQTAVGASVVMVLLNLCCLLPLVVLGWHMRQQYLPPASPADARAAVAPATTQSISDDPSGDVEPLSEGDTPPVLSFPIAVWRIDTVLLILLGLILLPVSLNLWEMRRLDGMLLIIIYACYLVGTTILGRRW